MSIAEVIDDGSRQTVTLPAEVHIDGSVVSVRQEGNAVILEPIADNASSSSGWPEGFFDEIRIDDPKFVRPGQGQLAPAPELL